MVVKKHHSIGIILFFRFPRKIKYLLLKQHQGHWGFPKGHVEKGEKYIETAVRELKEETGIKKIKLIKSKILLRDFYSYNNGKNKITKNVDYFIAESYVDIVKIDNYEIINYKWLTFEKGVERLTFSKSKKILKKANKLIDDFISSK